MMVTFVSECEKKALPKTRRVLDAFANRIGQRTWQTVITQQGLEAIKKSLRQTATKNTAVSCHWMRSRSRSEFMWIVGNRSKFNNDGYVPVNRTQKDIMNIEWENDWTALPLIKSLTAMAALFHDWGKSSELFQTKLNPELKKKNPTPKGDPIRHEWISVLFLQAVVNEQSDEKWLSDLHQVDLDSNTLIERVKEQSRKPFKNLPPVAQSVAWLILSHHRMPTTEKAREDGVNDPNQLLNQFTTQWGYENRFKEDDFQRHLPRCFTFENGLPCDSPSWKTQAKKWAERLQTQIASLTDTHTTGTWRLVLSYARQSLMLGDHYFSSKDLNPGYKSDLNLYANTYKIKQGDCTQTGLKQRLDEHLLGVTKIAVTCANMLPMIEATQSELTRAYDLKSLKQASPTAFSWQDKAVTKIKQWRLLKKENAKRLSDDHFGFFTVNMASTGKGKTFANAKIMRALSPNQDSLRYVLALGLRTLTLQTGTEYKNKIGLSDDEMAVLIGSKAVLDLYEKASNLNDKEHKIEESIAEKEESFGGSYSEEALLDHEQDTLIYDGALPEDYFTTLLKSQKDKQFLHAPVLACTIDHLMAATETSRGGRYILPSMRLMSSDLVIDEIDDFEGEDAQAIGRLVHLAGMLGRKVMIASATITPDIAEGYFNAYQAGWKVFAKLRNKDLNIGCAWVDEFKTQTSTITLTEPPNKDKDKDKNVKSIEGIESVKSYQIQHEKFIAGRVKNLAKEPVKRRADIVLIKDKPANVTLKQHYYQTILETVLETHDKHAIDYQNKRISVGLVRFANITPCVEFTQFLLTVDLPEDTEIKTMAYHSRQVLMMRHAQEAHLDAALKRNTKDNNAIFKNDVFKNHIDNHAKDDKIKNIIFVLVATPVVEVGRDYDFDWGVVEPSSYRSIIQLAGRIRRHRPAHTTNTKPNIRILQYNLRGYQNIDTPGLVVFNFPGYESKQNKLKTHDMANLVNTVDILNRLDALPRIVKPSALNPTQSLSCLEHSAIQTALTPYKSPKNHFGPKGLQGWLQGAWWLTASSQLWIRFRRSQPEIALFLLPDDTNSSNRNGWIFAEKIDSDFLPREQLYNIKKASNLTEKAMKRLWLFRDYEALLDKTHKSTLKKSAQWYGEISLPRDDSGNKEWTYCEQLGLVRSN